MPATNTAVRTESSSPVVAVGLIAASALLAMSVWFSATFVIPQLRTEWDLSGGATSLLTIAVQVGFVAGALGSAAFGVADVIASRRLICIGSIGAAACNAGLLLADSLPEAIPLRLATGVFLAGVYPPALKEVSTWFLKSRGKALGVMIGALTIGSALPHLVGAIGGVDWRTVITTTSVLTALGGVLVLTVRGEGPHPFPKRPFNLAAGFKSMRSPLVALANLGYAGHMWELYAMWAGVGAFIMALRPFGTGQAPWLAPLLAFACIAVGAAGCLLGGILGDRWGRPKAALLSLVCSGGAALSLAAVYAVVPFWVSIAICAFWGFWVIADSAQFSAMVTEAADPDYVGGALSLQLALGYITTTATLWLIPHLVAVASWHLALVVLAAGPAVGAAAMVLAHRASQADLGLRSVT